ncbi:MAG: type II secretion system F family protein [Desulfopila sp.]|jgi:type II secretory pathway component PulF|nr:type II secretion system F family protein [Desulfopila sp.]
MPRFFYTAMNVNGQLEKAEGEFASVPEMFQTLERRGLSLIKYRKAFFSQGTFIKSKMTRVKLAEFFRNLALLLKGGVPLRESLQDLTSGTGQPVLKQVFGRVQRRLEDGILLSESLAIESKHIPSVILPLVSIGEETGQLDKTLEDAARHLEKVQEIISSTRRALIYPSFVLVAMFGAFIFWMVFVLPQLLELFKTMGLKELPLATRILISSVHYFNILWPIIPIVILLVLLFYLVSRKNEKLHYAWDLTLSYIPIVGTILRSSQLAFFFEYTSLLTSGGIHIVRSLELMRESASNRILRKSVSHIEEDIVAGDSMSDAISRLKFFEPFVLRMVSVGEQTGKLPEQFKILADYYITRVNKLVETMSKTLEPVIIAVAGVIFMVIALGLLGPVYNLVSAIQ